MIEASTDEDLSEFSLYLAQQRIRHRIYEESGQQILEVEQADHAGVVRQAYRDWRGGSIRPAPPQDPGASETARATFTQRLVNAKAISALILLSLFCYPLVDSLGTQGAWVHHLLFQPDVPWRWITPIFLHFSLVHLLFNSAVVWELGRRLEAAVGPIMVGALCVLLGLVSNWAQFLWSDTVLFGGLSGVAYGLLGALVVLARVQPEQEQWWLPPGVAGGLLIFLVIFSTGITESFGLYVANAAHWGGLLAGAGAAFLWHLAGGRPYSGIRG